MLHDGVQQHLALLGLKLSMLQKQIRTDPAAAEDLCVELRTEIQAALGDLRNVALLVYPALLDNEGLAAALRRSAARYPVPVEVVMEESSAIPADLVAPLYFCIIETIELVAPYAAEPMHTQISADEHAVAFEVTAPRAGVSAEVLSHAMGYLTDRVTSLGGVITVESGGKAVTITGSVPW